jgi:hypothetical protein
MQHGGSGRGVRVSTYASRRRCAAAHQTVFEAAAGGRSRVAPERGVLHVAGEAAQVCTVSPPDSLARTLEWSSLGELLAGTHTAATPPLFTALIFVTLRCVVRSVEPHERGDIYYTSPAGEKLQGWPKTRTGSQQNKRRGGRGRRGGARSRERGESTERA